MISTETHIVVVASFQTPLTIHVDQSNGVTRVAVYYVLDASRENSPYGSVRA